jgi:hypothetical protein
VRSEPGEEAREDWLIWSSKLPPRGAARRGGLTSRVDVPRMLRPQAGCIWAREGGGESGGLKRVLDRSAVLPLTLTGASAGARGDLGRVMVVAVETLLRLDSVMVADDTGSRDRLRSWLASEVPLSKAIQSLILVENR